MSYLDQPRMTPTRIWAIAIVAIIHVLLGIAFVTGFANKFVKQVTQDLKVVDVEEPPPPEEEPPPPEEQPQAPEVVTPPPLVRTPPPPQPPQRTVETQPPAQFNPLPPTPNPAPPTPPPPPPPPPPPSSPPTPATQVGGSISDADYPAAAIRAEAQGTTTVSIQIGANGRVTGCSVAGSSGNGALDSTACSLVQRRFRFRPATQGGQPVASSTTRRITWRLPRD